MHYLWLKQNFAVTQSNATMDNDSIGLQTAVNQNDVEDSVKETLRHEDKVKVHFQAVGSAPILKRSKFQISADQRFVAVHVFLRKILKLHEQPQSNLFLYCQSAFVPGPDTLVGDLRDNFSVRGELVVHYSLMEAWG
jgi:ubiquitin-like protein ATG12